MQPILNISAYRFGVLENLSTLRDDLLEQAINQGIKGTIIIASEGINLFLAAPIENITSWLEWLCKIPAFENMTTKNSWSEYQPYKKMLVKIKPEIIRMNHPTIHAYEKRAPSITPEKLQQWLRQGHDDANRPILLLDTRNSFEVAFGTFKNAVHFDLKQFSEFPSALEKNQAVLKDKTVISFCTGGIRCEKANLLMQEIGIENTLQLEGGILNYFEQVGQTFYQGDCFVFDERLALTPSLQEIQLNSDQSIAKKPLEPLQPSKP